jgi:hypothetical protein
LPVEVAAEKRFELRFEGNNGHFRFLFALPLFIPNCRIGVKAQCGADRQSSTIPAIYTGMRITVMSQERE